MTPAIVLRSFYDLTLDELYALLRLRSEVFVVEQQSVYSDCDGLDKQALHLLGFQDEELVAYARILAPGTTFPDAASIGRVVTSATVRRSGWGRPLVREAIFQCREHYPGEPVKIRAQSYLAQFYSEFGFMQEGEEYDLDGIPHINMTLPATKKGTLTT